MENLMIIKVANVISFALRFTEAQSPVVKYWSESRYKRQKSIYCTGDGVRDGQTSRDPIS